MLPSSIPNLVDWLGYNPSERTWEPVEHVANAQDLLADFHRHYPDKPGPHSAFNRYRRRLKGGDSVMKWQNSNSGPYVIWVELLTIIPSIVICKILVSFKFYYRKLMYIPDFYRKFHDYS